MSDDVPERMVDTPPDESVRVRRAPQRARYDRAAVESVIDASLVAHVGVVRDGSPVVIPMFAVRDGERLLLHGSPAAGVFRHGRGTEVCVTMTLVDGLVLARSALHHSMNYRSVVVLGTARPITDPDVKAATLDLLVDALVPGRQATLRATTVKEVRSTEIAEVSLERASVKVRTGDPVDDEDDHALDVWAGVVPVTTVLGDPVPDARLRAGIEAPAAVRALAGRTR